MLTTTITPIRRIGTIVNQIYPKFNSNVSAAGIAGITSIVSAHSNSPSNIRPFKSSSTVLSSTVGSKKLWGGRFTKDTDPRILKWIDSIPIDRNLAVEDTWGSIAHTSMLGVQGIIPAEDSAKIVNKLLDFQNQLQDNKFELGRLQDDVHMDIEAQLIESIGQDSGGKMHACRSRNDQVILDSKLFARKKLLELRESTIIACQAFLTRAEGQLNNVMVSYTHVQHAQPISVAYWLTHYSAILIRDLDRLKSNYDLTDSNPLGSGAIAGTSFPIDRELTKNLLGFQFQHEHGLDATSSRDFMLSIASSIAILNTTLSRLAEELILWSSFEFRTISLDDGFAMGSSMMPQKKNPGSIELLRGRSGRINGLLIAGLTMMKGLPSGYNRDFHEDKEILVEIFNLILPATGLIQPLIQSMTINHKRMAELPNLSFSTATELANFLVAKYNVPFRSAHHIVGSLVGELSRAGQDFSNRDYVMKHLEKNNIKPTKQQLESVLDPASVMSAYNSLGGTGPKAVQDMMNKMNSELNKARAVLNADKLRVDTAFNACRAIAQEAKGINNQQQFKQLVMKHLPKQK